MWERGITDAYLLGLCDWCTDEEGFFFQKIVFTTSVNSSSKSSNKNIQKLIKYSDINYRLQIYEMRASLISALVRLEMNNSRSDCGQWLLLVNLCWVSVEWSSYCFWYWIYSNKWCTQRLGIGCRIVCRIFPNQFTL